MPEMRSTIQRFVGTIALSGLLVVEQIASTVFRSPLQRFAAVIMRIREPKTTALIFSSGKMVITGAKSEDFAKLAARKYARIIQKLGFPAKFSAFKIQNIVGSCDVKFPIRLEGLAYAHGPFSSCWLLWTREFSKERRAEPRTFGTQTNLNFFRASFTAWYNQRSCC